MADGLVPRRNPLTPFTPDAVDALGGPERLRQRRLDALERFTSLPLPTAALEEWRYGRVDQLDLDRYRPWRPDDASRRSPLPGWLEGLLVALSPAALVVVHDGGDPDVRRVDAGVDVVDADEADGLPAVLRPDAFTVLNEAMSTPVTLRIRAGSRPSGPVVVVHWCDADGTATFPRTHIEVGDGAEAAIVEVAVSGDVAALTVPVTEIEVGDGAVTRYLHLQCLGRRVWQIGTQASRVGRDADFTSNVIALGGDYARLRTDSAMSGPGSTTRLLAAYFASGVGTVDFRTTQDHRAPRTTSELLFKGAVANQARAVYTGLIRVEKGARGTNAFQTNRNLVLHEGAHADSVPNLEIEDNDVRCSHASAVGPIADDQRFYLESRGVPPRAAARLITLGFLDEVLARMPFGPVVAHVRLDLLGLLESAEATEAAAGATIGSPTGPEGAGA
ncbi:MAG TPA: SufD family Fe-S cluster assembly protein [Acidimicrobiales bacterium]|nr:SufD family Fe-S cluster assembly protein [Acidimicrobiales bacterium]